MSVSFLVVPQWQGSGSSRAMQLVDGAGAIADDLPRASTTLIDVPLEAGDAEGTGILRHSSLTLVRERMEVAMAGLDGPVVTIGGDCGVDYAGIARAVMSGDTALVWLDAHADANSPATSPSHAFHGMIVRSLVDDGVLAADRIVLAATRSWDEAETEWVTEVGVRTADVDAVRSVSDLVEAVAATGASRVYVHVDLDVLDPGEIGGLGFPEPFGLSTAELVAAIRALKERFDFAGGAITEYAPSSPEAVTDDMGTILRVLGALTSSRPANPA